MSVFPPSQEVKRGRVITFPRDQSKLNIPMTTSKKTKLGKGGRAPWYPPLRERLYNTYAHGDTVDVILRVEECGYFNGGRI